MVRRIVVVVAAAVAVNAASAQQRPPAKPATLAELEARVRSDSLDPESHFRLATRYYTLKRFDDEERELHTTIEIDPRYAPAYLWLGDLPFDRRSKLWKEVRKGKVPPELQPAVEESFRLWRQAFLIDPMVDFRVVGAFGAARYELSYGALDLWAQRANAGKPVDSLPDFLFFYRGLAAGHQRLYNRAIADIQVLLARSLKAESADTLLPFPMRTNDHRYVLAVLNQAWGRRAEAIRLYQEAIAADLGLYMGHVRLSQIYRAYQPWDQAIGEAQRAIETNPEDPTAVRELGVILSEAGRTAQAEEALGRAAAANPRDPRTIYHLGVVRQQLAKPTEARETLARFVAIAPATRYARELADARQRLATLGP